MGKVIITKIIVPGLDFLIISFSGLSTSKMLVQDKYIFFNCICSICENHKENNKQTMQQDNLWDLQLGHTSVSIIITRRPWESWRAARIPGCTLVHTHSNKHILGTNCLSFPSNEGTVFWILSICSPAQHLLLLCSSILCPNGLWRAYQNATV